MKRLRIFLTGADHVNWALDTEFALARRALSTFADVVTNPTRADFIHTVDVDTTAGCIWRNELVPHVPVVGAINNHPTRLVEFPHFVEVARRSMVLVPQSLVAELDLVRLGLPYPGRVALSADFAYHPIAPDDASLAACRRRLAIPDHRYLIGLLQRDTEGRDLRVPKYQKGPDIFLALMLRLAARVGSNRFHVLLGGPRRHWLREQLTRHGIPFSFAGTVTTADDHPGNILDKTAMCELYNLLDLYVIPTRWEGAPRQLFDIICCRRKLISTPVGIVPEVLDRACLFDNLETGADLIARDMDGGFLASFTDRNLERVRERHTPERVGADWRAIYDTLAGGRFKTARQPRLVQARLRQLSARGRRIMARIGGPSAKARLPATFGVMAGIPEAPLPDLVRRSLEARGLRSAEEPDVFLAFGIPPPSVRWPEVRLPLLHVVDGAMACALDRPPQAVRDGFAALQARAHVTVCTHSDVLAACSKAGWDLRDPCVIRWPPDPLVFGAGEALTRQGVLLLTGDEESVEGVGALCSRVRQCGLRVTVIANRPMTLDGAEVHEAPPPTERACLARDHAVALIAPGFRDGERVEECLVCGLPCLVHEHDERLRARVGMAGLSYRDADTLGAALDEILGNLAVYRSAIALPRLEDSGQQLADLIRQTI